ncbi:MAG: DUF4115 domain-containing protein [Alphaproteobacteria bacterium]
MAGSDQESESTRGSATRYTGAVGTILRGARLARDEELSEVASALRIRLPYLEAIEEGRQADLPGLTYGIGFVRAYAVYVGLDPDILVQRFKDESRGLGRQTQLQFPEPLPGNRVPSAALLFVAFLFAAAAYGGWLYTNSQDMTFIEAVEAVPQNLMALLESDDDEAEAEPAPDAPDAVNSDTPAPAPEAAGDASGGQEISEPSMADAEEAVAEAMQAATDAVQTAVDEAATAVTDAGQAVESAIAPADETQTDPALTTAVESEPPPTPEPAQSTETVIAATDAPETAPAATAVDAQQAAAAPVTDTAEGNPPAAPEEEVAAAPAAAQPIAQPESPSQDEPAGTAEPPPADSTATEQTAALGAAPATEEAAAPAAENASGLSSGETENTAAPSAPAIEQTELAPPPDEGGDDAATDSAGTEIQSTNLDAPPPEPAESQVEAVAAAADAGADANRDTTEADSAAPDSAPVQEAAAPPRIIIQATNESWIKITAPDGAVLVERLMLMGEIYRVPYREGLVMDTGNAGALKLIVNGTLVPPLGESGAVVQGISLAPEDLLP